MARVTAPLIDSFGRVHRDLRISVTDRCNFRCTYCMPAEGMAWRPREELLTFEEIHRVATLMVERFGIDSIRLTGGEPTVRAHLPRLVEMLSALPVDLALTTNGASLALVAGELARAGLRRINVSCDSLRPGRFAEITKRDALARVLEGVDAALAAGLEPVKLNVVVVRGVNDDELVDFAAYGRSKGVVVRFIEFMPLDAQGQWMRDQVVTYDEIHDRIDAVWPLEPVERGSAPAERFRYRDGGGQIGIIASVTRSFCSTCDRVRLTADGQFRTCLFATADHDLRTALRSGASDDELAALVATAVAGKGPGHLIGDVLFVRPNRSMSEIGG
jgi:cyclic pyranopterin phosphate synthase